MDVLEEKDDDSKTQCLEPIDSLHVQKTYSFDELNVCLEHREETGGTSTIAPNRIQVHQTCFRFLSNGAPAFMDFRHWIRK